MEPATRSTQFRIAALLALLLLSALYYAVIAYRSYEFEYHAQLTLRPVLWVTACFGLEFLAYLAAVYLICKLPASRGVLWVVFAGAVLFRVLMLPTTPIQEIDIYRYMWDGAVVREGVSPFRYSPEQVQNAVSEELPPDDLAALVRLRDSSPTHAEILSRIHYGSVPTVYPPVSQAVFAAADFTTPSSATIHTRLVIFKAWFVALDLATMALVAWLLAYLGKPPQWCVIYGWQPLLMKEVANSGHLDAIAVFLATLAVVITVRAMFPKGEQQRSVSTTVLLGAIAGVVLGLAVGAKLYPVVLAPVFFAILLTRLKFLAAIPVNVFIGVAFITLYPMLPGEPNVAEPIVARHSVAGPTSPNGDGATWATDDLPSNTQNDVIDIPPPPQQPPSVAPTPADPSTGLQTFLGRWEKNDFLFLIVHENLRPNEYALETDIAWFIVTPNSWRNAFCEAIAARFHLQPQRVPFLAARAATGLAYLIITTTFFAIIIAKRKTVTAEQWLRLAFLSLAWFWLLAPTQNPWYWTWALPLLPFARAKAWMLLGGVAFAYYTSFYFTYHHAGGPVWGDKYHGAVFFDLVVTWIEFAPWFGLLILESLWRMRRDTTDQSSSE